MNIYRDNEKRRLVNLMRTRGACKSFCCGDIVAVDYFTKKEAKVTQKDQKNKRYTLVGVR